MRIKEVADLAGISVRTLRYYDQIGLLKPDRVAESGYRIYSEENLETLQQILFFRELGFPLKKIKEIMQNPSFDRLEALELHRKYLLEKKRRIDQMLRTVDKTIKYMKGETTMTREEKFSGFDFSENPYEKEARERWGDAAVDEANRRIGELNEEQKQVLQEEMGEIYRNLAACRHLPPDSEEAQEAIGKWYELLNRHFGNYSPEMFKNLGQMYVEDSRFKKNIDRFGDGLAAFMRDAMAVFADRQNPSAEKHSTA
ncbi:MAG: MerR family transcriptional regulator [Caldibacillus debilis]|uniref:MerR family transcriptional regulator n=1 Tax=Caldibacillus debilis TaxID=301148 RepID=A0A3E0K4D7_9BACI|nr:MerR family transcriptional regulator [Caldibacillus debilis]REJ23293.1 MAG: MerR family transcriptional regulator [Caldibacillus debilis]REJ28556.1 MAG: MerR family transcriptional regulator [Caldibacillus debilis]